MPVDACRLAGLSALGAHYAGVKWRAMRGGCNSRRLCSPPILQAPYGGRGGNEARVPNVRLTVPAQQARCASAIWSGGGQALNMLPLHSLGLPR